MKALIIYLERKREGQPHRASSVVGNIPTICHGRIPIVAKLLPDDGLWLQRIGFVCNHVYPCDVTFETLD